jgi:hypothetical protein
VAEAVGLAGAARPDGGRNDECGMMNDQPFHPIASLLSMMHGVGGYIRRARLLGFAIHHSSFSVPHFAQ